MLKRIVIENYRSCLRTHVNLPTNLSVLIGPNSSGKTNILHAILLLNRMAHEDEPYRTRTSPSNVSSRIRATFQSGKTEMNLRAIIAAYPDEANNDVIQGERQRWTITEPKNRKSTFHLPLQVAAQIPSHRPFREYYVRRWYYANYGRTAKPPDLQPWTRTIINRVFRYCHGMRYYGASQFTNPGACPTSFEIEQEGERTRLHRLRGHTRILYNMYTAQKSGAAGYQNFIEIAGPRGLRLIDNLKFRVVNASSAQFSVRVGGKVEVRRRNKLLVIPRFRIGKQELSPNQLSEGTFKTLALLFHIFTDDSTALLIEEPEVCVHHGLLSSILDIIKSSSSKKQMIISTHSDYVLDSVRPENVLVVVFDKSKGTTVSPIKEKMTTAEFSALRRYLEHEGNLGDYWREGGLGDLP